MNFRVRFLTILTWFKAFGIYIIYKTPFKGNAKEIGWMDEAQAEYYMELGNTLEAWTQHDPGRVFY